MAANVKIKQITQNPRRVELEPKLPGFDSILFKGVTKSELRVTPSIPLALKLDFRGIRPTLLQIFGR